MEAATPIYPGSIQIRSESRQLSSSNLDLTKPSSHVSSRCCIPILPFLKISMTQSQPQKDAFLSELDILIGSRKCAPPTPPRPPSAIRWLGALQMDIIYPPFNFQRM